MHNRRLFWCAAFLATLALIPGSAPAMTIDNFARLTLDDEASYVAMMVARSAKMLRTQGKADQADKAVALFKDSSKSGGVNQFAMNLKAAHNRNNLKATNPNNRTPDLQVEDAMAATLKDNGIGVPVSFLLSLQREFQPSGIRRKITLEPSVNHP
jgi:hypothetical protein